MIVELLDELRDGMTKNAFTRKVGISRRMLGMLYARQRSLGAKTMQLLVQSFPEQRERIIGVFLTKNEHKWANYSYDVPKGDDRTSDTRSVPDSVDIDCNTALDATSDTQTNNN